MAKPHKNEYLNVQVNMSTLDNAAIDTTPIQILGANRDRKMLIVGNHGAGSVLVGLGFEPSSNLGIELVPAGHILLDNTICQQPIYVRAKTSEAVVSWSEYE